MTKVVVPFPKGQRLRSPLAQFFRVGDLPSLLKRTRGHAETMGKVADALERLHEERRTESPRFRACDFNVDIALRRGDQR